jgi:inorganic pyrophosphatase
VTTRNTNALLEVMKVMFKPHPWHGISMGERAPEIITCFIEIVPTDSVKYEIEKTSGYLKVDRPQRYSSFSPCLYGLVPRTYCGTRVAAFSAEMANRNAIEGDQDPLEVCVFTEKTIPHGDLLLEAIPIGGLRLLDGTKLTIKSLPFSKTTPYLDLYGTFPNSPKG